METIEKKATMLKVDDEVFIYVTNDIQIKFSKVFEWSGSNRNRVCHLNIWDDNAPFYIIFNASLMHKSTMKGYRNSFFILNNFKRGFDKNNKMFLRNVDTGSNCYLKYYPITSIKDIRNIATLRTEGHEIYAGFPASRNISTFGEAFEIVTL